MRFKPILLLLFLCSLLGWSQTITGGGLAVSCNAVTTTGACTSYSLSAPSGNLPGAFSWQVITTGSPSAISTTLQGSIDGTNWTTLDTSTATAGELRSVTGKPMRNLRCNLGTLTGGAAPTVTCQFTVTSSSAGGSNLQAGTNGLISANNVAPLPLDYGMPNPKLITAFGSSTVTTPTNIDFYVVPAGRRMLWLWTFVNNGQNGLLTKQQQVGMAAGGPYFFIETSTTLSANASTQIAVPLNGIVLEAGQTASFAFSPASTGPFYYWIYGIEFDNTGWLKSIQFSNSTGITGPKTNLLYTVPTGKMAIVASMLENLSNVALVANFSGSTRKFATVLTPSTQTRRTDCPVTNYALTTNVATVTCANNFAVNDIVRFGALTGGTVTFNNDTQCSVTSASGSQFTCPITHADVTSVPVGAGIAYDSRQLVFQTNSLATATTQALSNLQGPFRLNAGDSLYLYLDGTPASGFFGWWNIYEVTATP